MCLAIPCYQHEHTSHRVTQAAIGLDLGSLGHTGGIVPCMGSERSHEDHGDSWL